VGQKANGDSALIVQSSALKNLSPNLLSFLQDLYLIYRLEMGRMCEFTLD